MKFAKPSIYLVAVLIACVFFSFAFLATTQAATEEESTVTVPEIKPRRLEAVAGESQNVAVGSKITFDGSKSVNSLDGKLTYVWDFGNGETAEGVNEVYAYDQPGNYIVRLTIDNGEEQDSDEIFVSVYENLVVLIADNTPSEKDLVNLEQNAAREGVLVIRIQDTSGQPDYIIIEDLAKGMVEQRTNIQKSNLIIDWTSGSVGLNSLTKFVQKSGGIEELDLAHKVIVTITSKAGVLSRIAQQTFDVVKPEFILLTDVSGVDRILNAKNANDVLENMRLSRADYKIIGIHSERSVKELGWTNFMSYTINFMVNKSVPINTIFLILIIPIIATIIAVFRQVIGIKAFGLYIPTILTLSFLVTGIKYGLIIFVAILVVATLIRYLLKFLRILYLPRMAIVLTSTAIAIFVMFALGAYTQRTGFIVISIFPILIIAILAEEFVKVQIEKGLWTAVQLAIETLVISTLCYSLVSWETLRTFFLSYPETVLLTLPINYLLGKWTGLRLSEFIRFKQLRKHGQSS